MFLYNSTVRLCTRLITFGDFTRCVLYNSSVRLCNRSITFGDFTRFVLYNSAIRLCTRLINFGDFTRCVLYNSAIRLCTRSITFGDFIRCVLCNSTVRLCTRSITIGDFIICVLYNSALDCVPNWSLLVISTNVFSINSTVLINFIGIYRYVKLYSQIRTCLIMYVNLLKSPFLQNGHHKIDVKHKYST